MLVQAVADVVTCLASALVSKQLLLKCCELSVAMKLKTAVICNDRLLGHNLKIISECFYELRTFFAQRSIPTIPAFTV